MRAVYGRCAVAANASQRSAYHARILDDASRPAPAADTRAALRPRVALLAAVLLVLHAALAIGSMWESSPTFDEVSHLPAGLAIVRTGEVRLNREHPPLVKELAGLAASTQRPRLPLDGDAYARADQWRFGREVTYGGGNDTMAMLRAGRLPVVALSLLAAAVCFVWARQRFGDAAGLAALVLYAFSPIALAHGALVTTDAAAALGVVATMWLWWRATRGERHGWLAYAFCGLALGAALAAKLSAVLLLPMMLLCDLLANGARDCAGGCSAGWSSPLPRSSSSTSLTCRSPRRCNTSRTHGSSTPTACPATAPTSPATSRRASRSTSSSPWR